METLERQFSARVSAFLEWTGMSPTAFGMKALGDPNFLRQMARGRSPTLRTADRALAYIARYPRDSGGARAPPRRPRRRPRRRRPPSKSRNPGRTRRERERPMERPMERKRNRPDRILRLREVQARTGLSRSTIYRWRLAGRFPPAVVLGRRTVGWFESDLEAWFRERTAASRGGGRPPSTDPSEKGKRR